MAEKTIAEKKASSLKRKNALIGYSFIAPNFIGFAIFILFPVLFTLVLSVMDWDGFNAMTFAGLANFKSIFRDRVFKSSFWLTLLYVVCTVVLTLLASLGLACALNKKIKGRDAFRAAIFFPYVASMIAIGAVWKQLFEANNGPINHLLRSIGISNPPGWFASTDWAIYGVIIVAIWKFMGYYMLIYLAGLQDELHAPLRVGLREDVRAGGCLFRRGEGLVGVVAREIAPLAHGHELYEAHGHARRLNRLCRAARGHDFNAELIMERFRELSHAGFVRDRNERSLDLGISHAAAFPS